MGASHSTGLQSTDIDTWYTPKFDRMAALNLPKGGGLHGLPWAVFLAQFVDVIWIVALASTIRFALKSPDLASLGHRKSLALPVILVLLAWALRLLLYAVVELKFAHRTFAKAQYVKWTSTFASSGTPSVTARPPRPFTVQFRPWWVALITIFLGIMLVVVGLTIKILFWARFAGGAILAEMMTRIIAELCWTHCRWLRRHLESVLSRYLPERLRQRPRSHYPHPKTRRARMDDVR